MRHLSILIILSVGLVLPAHAQITFTSKDYLEKILVDHNSYRTTDTSGFAALVRLTGEDTVWDFSNKTYSGPNLAHYTLEQYPGSGKLSASPMFLNSTHVRSNTAGRKTFYSYYTFRDSVILYNGVEQDSAGIPSVRLYYDPPEKLCHFPMVFGASWSNDMMQYIPATDDTNHIVDRWEVDGWGRIVIPNVGTLQAVRAKLTRPDFSYSIHWYTMSGDYAVLSLSSGSQVPAFTYYLALDASAPQVLSDPDSQWLTAVARGKRLLVSGEGGVRSLHVILCDNLGRELLASDLQMPSGLGEIDLHTLARGVYFCRFSTDSRSAYRKIVIGE